VYNIILTTQRNGTYKNKVTLYRWSRPSQKPVRYHSVCLNAVSTLAIKFDARNGHEEERLNLDKECCPWTCATVVNVHRGNVQLFDMSFLVCPADVPAIFRLLPYSPQTISAHPRYRHCDALPQFHGGLCVSEERKLRPLWTHRGSNLNVSDVGTRGPYSSLLEPMRQYWRGRLYGMVVVRHFVENNGTSLWFYSCDVRWFTRIVFWWLFI
jgi:hypothetical protein